ncbi:ribbon-helix-helix protein, CopG family [Lysobacter antibioticus]|uniref:ribbon-helix-helix protein, CopG family n=1 Tax=Lysobacter antibioticus TaxID=84531 RepID=UPI00094EE8BD
MARPPIAPDRKTVRTSVLLPEEMHYRLSALAGTNGVSAAWVVRIAVQRFLEEHQGQLELPLRLSDSARK